MATHSSRDDQSKRKNAIRRLLNSPDPRHNELGKRGQAALDRENKAKVRRAQKEKNDRKNPPRPE